MLRRRRPRLAPVIVLESRVLLSSVTAVGGEFQVNTYTAFEQLDAAVAMDADGDFVVTWTSAGEGEGSYYSNVYAQRYNAAGVAQGPESRVNTYNHASQYESAVAMNAAGNYVITWSSSDLFGPSQDGSASGIFAQRYNAAGNPVGSEFQVNTYTTGTQSYSSVAIDANGNFVVVWGGNGSDGDGYGVYARRFNAAGTALGDQFQVNTTTTGGQYNNSVAMDADGDFVITWEGPTDGSDRGIFAQRYNSSGVAQGGEFRVNTNTLGRQQLPDIAMDADGNFVIAWNTDSGGTVAARRYNAAGVAQGAEFAVDSSGLGAGYFAVAMDADGDFVITWNRGLEEGGASDNQGIYGRLFNAAGVAQGADFHINTYTSNGQRFPAVAASNDGHFVVAWQSEYQDGYYHGVYAQRYAYVVQEPPTNIALSATSIAENQPIGTIIGNLSATDPDVGDTFTYSLVSGTGSTNNASFGIVGNQLKSAVVFDYESKNSYSIRVRVTDQAGLFFEKAFTVTITDVNETVIDLDDQISEAIAISSSGIRNGVIDIPTDVDMYSFTVQRGERIALDLDRRNGSALDSYLRIFDAAGNEYIANDDGPTPGEAPSHESYLDWTFGGAGTYYVGVSGHNNSSYDPLTGTEDVGGSTGDYTLTLTRLGFGGPDDPDDQISEAVAISSSGIRNGGLDISTDVDMFSFSVQAGERIAIDLDRRNGSDLDSYLRLFDTAGYYLTANDDGPTPGEAPSYESYIDWTFASAGTYYVGVSGYPNLYYNSVTGTGDISGGTGEYTVTLTRLGFGGADDPDDQISEAVAISSSGIRNGTIDISTDVDMFSFAAQAGERIALDFDNRNGSLLNSYLRVFDAAGNQLIANDDGPNPDEDPSYESYLEWTFATTGTYYVGVSSFLNTSYNALTGTGDVSANTAEYTLTLTRLAPPANRAPTVTPDTFTIRTRAPAGSVVGTVTASDPDVGQTLTYEIIGGNTRNTFAINPSTGVLTLARSVASRNSFALTVRATDNGSPALSGTAVITVQVTRTGTLTAEIATPTAPIARSSSVSTSAPATSKTLVFANSVVNPSGKRPIAKRQWWELTEVN